mgnify:FL=1
MHPTDCVSVLAALWARLVEEAQAEEAYMATGPSGVFVWVGRGGGVKGGSVVCFWRLSSPIAASSARASVLAALWARWRRANQRRLIWQVRGEDGRDGGLLGKARSGVLHTESAWDLVAAFNPLMQTCTLETHSNPTYVLCCAVLCCAVSCCLQT